MSLVSLKITTANQIAGTGVPAATSVQSVKVGAPQTTNLTVIAGAGPTGPTGAQGPPGVGAAWKGVWSSATTYAVGDGVTGSDGNNYISIAASNLNHNPTTDAGVHWSNLIAGSVELTTHKDAANGYPGLDAGGLLKVAEMPAAVARLTPTSFVSGASYTAAPWDLVITTATPVTLPAAPAKGVQVAVQGSSPTRVTAGGSDLIYRQGRITTTVTVPAGGTTILQYDTDGGYWRVLSDMALLPSASGRYNVLDYGATGDGSTDDHAAIQAALDAAGTTPVYLPAGRTYVISAPLVMNAGNRLVGDNLGTLYTPPGVNVPNPAGAIIKASSSFTANSGMIQIFDQILTGASEQPCGCQIVGLALDGNSTAFAGVWVRGGGETDTTVRDCIAYNMAVVGFLLEGGPAGTGGAAEGVYLTNCTAYGCGTDAAIGGHGFEFTGMDVATAGAVAAGCFDCHIFHCWAILCSGDGFVIGPHCADIQLDRCHSEWNGPNSNAGGSGYRVGSTDEIAFRGCVSDSNANYGFFLFAEAPYAGVQGTQCGIVLADCISRRDGRAGAASGYSGIRVYATGLVQISNHLQHVTNGDDEGIHRPQYGLRTEAGSYVQVTGGRFRGIVSGWYDDGTTTLYHSNVVQEKFFGTTLTDNPLSSTATTINVTSTASFPGSGTVQIDDELIDYTGTTSTSLTGCTRGAHVTTAASHTSGTGVYVITALVRTVS